MKPFLLLIWLLATSISVFAQESTLTFRNSNDSSSNYYLTVDAVGPAKGVLILLPGYGESPEYVYSETDLPKEAARQGLFTDMAMLQRGWQSFYVDEASQRTLDTLIREVQQRYKLDGKKLYLGGFSLGGSGVVRYAERAATSDKLPHPDVVFAIDPPLDFIRLYQSPLRQRQRGTVEIAVNEANFLIDRMNSEFGGSPTTALNRYIELSPYCYTDTTNRNASTMKNTPIQLISEPDIL